MSEHDDASLATLARIKRGDERSAAEQLRAARRRLDVEAAQLEAAQRYVAEYRGGDQDPASRGRALRDARRFQLKLEAIVEEQRAAVASERHNVEAAHARWLALRSQREALDKLLERRAGAGARRQQQAEQRQSDEQFSRTPGASERISIV